MAEQKEDKFNLPLVGVLALIAVVSSYIVYQSPLKTSRPVDQEAEKKAASQERVQSRLWQDPFDAVRTHRSNELDRQRNEKSDHDDAKTNDQGGLKDRDFKELIREIRDGVLAGESSNFRILPVFVDGNPYASGMQSRLKDRYSVVSALGAAGYMPEFVEYIRYFKWKPPGSEGILVPVERFKPKAKHRGSQPQVLVLWLKDQDFSERPLGLMNEFIKDLRCGLNSEETLFRVLGPRFSGTLSAMLEELKSKAFQAKELPSICPMPRQEFSALKDIHIYSYWPTAEDTFLLDEPPVAERHKAVKTPVAERHKAVEKLFQRADISLFRTIGTDAVLSEQLVNELRRRGVNLLCGKDKGNPKKCTPPRIALISEWDTLYGRALSRTFVAVAENMAENMAENGLRVINYGKLKSNVDKLRDDIWPPWVTRYSYLAGLDGELPPKMDSKATGETRTKDKTDDKDPRLQRGVEDTAEGRGQLDYVERLAAKLKLEEEGGHKKEFQAIGVLGSDVYDKLLILQALRKKFRVQFSLPWTWMPSCSIPASGSGRAIW